jgi:hypothetical protein
MRAPVARPAHLAARVLPLPRRPSSIERQHHVDSCRSNRPHHASAGGRGVRLVLVVATRERRTHVERDNNHRACSVATDAARRAWVRRYSGCRTIWLRRAAAHRSACGSLRCGARQRERRCSMARGSYCEHCDGGDDDAVEHCRRCAWWRRCVGCVACAAVGAVVQHACAGPWSQRVRDVCVLRRGPGGDGDGAWAGGWPVPVRAGVSCRAASWDGDAGCCGGAAVPCGVDPRG